jgi:hypothetical protein
VGTTNGVYRDRQAGRQHCTARSNSWTPSEFSHWIPTAEFERWLIILLFHVTLLLGSTQ